MGQMTIPALKAAQDVLLLYSVRPGPARLAGRDEGVVAMPLVISPGFPPGGGKGISVVPPRIHGGESGPITSFALRAGERPKGKRSKWDSRHHVNWKNDYQHPNMRNYFDRFVDRCDIPSVPRPQWRPHWNLDIPKDPRLEGDVYRVFDAAHARFQDQWQWIPKKREDSAEEIGEYSMPSPTDGDVTASATALKKASSVSALPNLTQPPRPRTPRRPEDLKKQRRQEAEWNKLHGTVFSRFNQLNHPNYRSYFDRWKDDPNQLGEEGNNNEPTWRLNPGTKQIGRSASQPDPLKHRGGLPGQPAWVGNF